jgi:trehalose 6-phosphate phosphatase
MAHILATSHLATHEAFAASQVLLAFDFDGTLAPITSADNRAQMRARTRRLLTEIAKRYPSVVISGRRLEDVTKRLNDVPLWHVSGNVGREPERVGSRSFFGHSPMMQI